jgi:cob(I)alamin adenosyltransferase
LQLSADIRQLLYNPFVKLYTRTGDTGETSLFDGTRVKKNDDRVDAYGIVDAHGPLDGELVAIQRDIFALGAQLADPADRLAARVTKAVVTDDHVIRLERLIDRLDAELPPLRRFIVAGGTPAASALHVARTVCRRAERRIVALEPPVEPVLIRYVNRLSDLLFVMARAANRRAGVPETEW